uniref:Uncharacterized protein n=1 Tax=Vitis vinifera TaxID=29760 RepID=F6H1V9_VITVI
MQLNDSLDDDFLLGRSPLTHNISFNIVGFCNGVCGAIERYVVIHF